VSVSETQRHQLFQWFEEAMGQQRAAVMMDLLPPVGWTDLATSADVRNLGLELRSEMAMLRSELHSEMIRLEGRLEHTLARMQRNLHLSLLASNATVAGVVLAAVQLG
jgi:hypothetical protein